MKRIICMALLMLATASVQAEKKLQVIDLAPDHVSDEAVKRSQDNKATQDAAAKIPPAEAVAFISRLNETVEHGHTLARSGIMNAVQGRNQAIALNKLQDEGARFGTLFARFAQCNNAATDAATSWQQLLVNDAKKFADYHVAYAKAAAECIKAAS